jgi:hypothetical protein
VARWGSLGQGRASRTILNGVSAARRNRVNPASIATRRMAAFDELPRNLTNPRINRSRLPRLRQVQPSPRSSSGRRSSLLACRGGSRPTRSSARSCLAATQSSAAATPGEDSLLDDIQDLYALCVVSQPAGGVSRGVDLVPLGDRRGSSRVTPEGSSQFSSHSCLFTTVRITPVLAPDQRSRASRLLLYVASRSLKASVPRGTGGSIQRSKAGGTKGCPRWGLNPH